MRKTSNDLTIDQALNHFLEEAKLMDSSLAQRVKTNWATLVGSAIAEQTTALWLQRGVFYLELRSPIWKQELSYRRQELRDRINSFAGKELAQEVRIV